MSIGKPAGVVPVGGIIAWAYSLTGTPALPDEFVQCNGQTLSDAQSPYNGVVIPSLNGTSDTTKRFLRGNSVGSGSTGGFGTHTHTISITTVATNTTNATTATTPLMYVAGNASSIPTCYDVVYVVRIK